MRKGKERERNTNDKEIETYRDMYEEAANKYVGAEKTINRMNKEGYIEERRGSKEVGKRETYSGYRKTIVEAESMEIEEELPPVGIDAEGKNGRL